MPKSFGDLFRGYGKLRAKVKPALQEHFRKKQEEKALERKAYREVYDVEKKLALKKRGEERARARIKQEFAAGGTGSMFGNIKKSAQRIADADFDYSPFHQKRRRR